ncbi:MAG TPA: tetratricopeptide repeat protein, partial [Thermoanaerobaculia bacterium]|nr:tetratricopeptide repeat protein [Thermoanaerobaculia bacterium]
MLSKGTRVSHYRILDHLGSGGMGEVYLAEDPRLSRRVALKLLPAEFTREHDRVRRFEVEARAASALNHPGIVTIHEIGEAEGSHFIVTEYIEGETLREQMVAAPMALRDALEVATQVAAALAAAHAAGIVHRDVKPENIMVRPDGYVKVLDFGLAKLTEPEAPREDAETWPAASRTQPGLVLGTVAYMSPEQARGLALDARTDIFSLGVVLYEMIAGRSPFAGPTVSDVIAAILERDPPPLARYTEQLPGELERIVTRALAKDREERYQTVKDMALDLKSLKQEVELDLRQKRSSQTDRSESRGAEPRRPSDPGRQPTADSSPLAARHNLPAQPTPLIGREEELQAADALLRQQTVRLLTLTGAGGTGKTRLALQMAADLLEDFESGAFLVSLASIRDPGLVASAIAQTLGVQEAGGTPLLEHLRQTLRDREMLLLLDNFEQVLAAGPLVAELLASCPRIKILVTSRAALHLRGEHELAVLPLPLPDLANLPPVETLPEYPSVALFQERAKAVRPDFALVEENARTVSEICARLDGLPLAIELAAARVRHLPPHEILTRLQSRLKLLTGGQRDLPARQQTIRGAIEWSYDLLEAAEKKLFRRLSVFVGGCTLDAAEAVCNAGGDPGIDVFEGVASLVDKSLLVQKARPDGEVRFLMLETVREYGLEQLAEHGESSETRRLHASFFLALAEQAEPELAGPHQKDWLDRLEREHDNLRASIEWAAQSGTAETGLRLAAALWRFWLVRGHLTEGRERLATLLAIGAAAGRSKTRAKALTGAGSLAQNQGDYEVARVTFEESLDLWREAGDEAGIASTLNNLGWVAWRRGDYEAARSLTEEGLSLHRKLRDQRGIAYSLNNLGWIAHHQGDYAAACALHEQTLSLRRELGDKRGIAFSMTNLGWALHKRGDSGHAVTLLEEAAAQFREVGEKQLLAFALNHLADVVCEQGDLARAESLLDKSLKLAREIGAKYSLAYGLCVLGNAVKEQNAARAEALYEESLALRREIGDTWGIAVALNALADLAESAGDAARATRFYQESLSVRKKLG